MSNIPSLIYKHVVGSDSPRDECDKLLIFVITLRETYINNDKPMTPPHNVYPLSPRLSKKLLDKKDPLDKQILELENKAELDVKVVELKGAGETEIVE